MALWGFAGNDKFSKAAGLIRLHMPHMAYIKQGLKLTLISRSNFLLLLSKSWSKSDRHRSYFLSLKADIWLDWVAKLCS